jgi:phosphoribosylformylglycinamidine (FGAM) synthase-like enzyme
LCIFSESLSRAFVEVNPENTQNFEKLCETIGIKYEKVGNVGGDKIKINSVEVDLERAKDIYFNTFPKIMKNELDFAEGI